MFPFALKWKLSVLFLVTTLISEVLFKEFVDLYCSVMGCILGTLEEYKFFERHNFYKGFCGCLVAHVPLYNR